MHEHQMQIECAYVSERVPTTTYSLLERNLSTSSGELSAFDVGPDFERMYFTMPSASLEPPYSNANSPLLKIFSVGSAYSVHIDALAMAQLLSDTYSVRKDIRLIHGH